MPNQHAYYIFLCSFSSSIEEERVINRRQLILQTTVALPVAAFTVPNALALNGKLVIASFFFN